MNSWFVYNFEFDDEQGVEEFKEYIEDVSSVEFPESELNVFQRLALPGVEDEQGVDFAWIHNYLYVTTMSDSEEFLHETADRWSRAVSAKMNATTETCSEASLFESEDGDSVKVDSYSGEENLGGSDVVYSLSMAHQFRFRVYSAQSPTNQMVPHASAYDVLVGTEEEIEGFATGTGVPSNPEGVEFLMDDHDSTIAYVEAETDAQEQEPESNPGDAPTSEQDAPTQSKQDSESNSLLQRLKKLFGL